VCQLQPTIIISHLPVGGIPAAHQLMPVTTVAQVHDELLATALLLESHGMPRNKIILDPGIGFGKTMQLNQELLQFADQVPDYAVMIGYSRKRFLGDQRMDLEPNLAAGKIAITYGAAYLRVHDVAGHLPLVA
jgi:dihydropteroate synthase